MKNWLRVVLPSNTYVSTAIMALFLATFVPPAFSLAMGIPVAFPLTSPLGLVLLIPMSIAYGLFRVVGFHPIWSRDYREWLKRTPWRWGLPLPVGPVHLVLQDVVLIVLATGFVYLHRDAKPLMVLLPFLVTYLLALALSLFLTGQSKHAYALSFGFGGLVYLNQSPPEMGLLLAALYVVAWHGLRDSLRRFGEWNVTTIDENPLFQLKPSRAREAAQSQLHGWPFDRLGPQRNRYSIRIGTAIAYAMLASWWCWVLMNELVRQAGLLVTQQEVFPELAFIFSIVMVTTRAAYYLNGYAAPISLLGRLMTFRWIIPGYDVVFAVPLLIASWGYGATILTFEFGWSILITAPALVGGQLLLALACPPSLDQWRLTGNHRIVHGAIQAAELQQTQ